MKLEAPCVVKTDGTIEDYPPADGKHFTLDEMQKAVGGLVEMVHGWHDDKTYMFANEEGLIFQLPLNPHAMSLVHSPLAGNLLVIPKEMLK